MRDPGLEEAVRAVGGVSELARQIGISQPSVSNWNRIPAERVLIVEAATGVDRKVLRPDLYGAAGTRPASARRCRRGARAGIRAARHAAGARAGCKTAGKPRRLARRRDAARCRACRARAGRERNHGRARRARILQPVHRARPRRTAALRLVLSHRLPARASAGAAARRSGAARHRARRRQLRARRSRRDPVRDHGGPCRAAACRRRRAPTSRFSRSIWRPGSGVSLPIWSGPKPPISIAE